MNTIICYSCTSFGFNDLFSYLRNNKLKKKYQTVKKKSANSKSQKNVMKENKTGG